MEYLADTEVCDGKDNDCDNQTDEEKVCNTKPVADAGPDQNVITSNTVTLNGSDSFDPEGTMIAFQWSFVEVLPEAVSQNHHCLTQQALNQYLLLMKTEHTDSI